MFLKRCFMMNLKLSNGIANILIEGETKSWISMQERMSVLDKSIKNQTIKIKKEQSFLGSMSIYCQLLKRNSTKWWTHTSSIRLKVIFTLMGELKQQELDIMEMLKEKWLLQLELETIPWICIINGFMTQSQLDKTLKLTSHQAIYM